MTTALYGAGASRGVRVSHAHIIRHGKIKIPQYNVKPNRIEEEVERLDAALLNAKDELRTVRQTISSDAPSDVVSFIDTHILMLEDGALSYQPKRLIREMGYNAEYALQLQRDKLVGVFSAMRDPYLRSRLDDVDNIVKLIQRFLLRQESLRKKLHNVQSLRGRIVVASDLTPADTLLLQDKGISGFVIEHGASSSHVAILAKSLGIPAVVGLRQASRLIHENELLILDGRYGVVLLDTDKRTIDFYHEKQRAEKKQHSALAKLKNLPCQTKDEKWVRLNANCELEKDFELACEVGAQGVGLYRTEMLYMNRTDFPDEEEHFRIYCSALKKLRGLPMTVRTADLGVDRQLPINLHRESPTNPAMGLRGIRFSLTHPSLFRVQLRALLRASAHGVIRIMIPMVSNKQEIMQTRQLFEKIKQELTLSSIPFDQNTPLGGMIEVPAAAICADQLAEHFDFMSIGTNDLIQYTLAVDRLDESVAHLFNPLHTAILRLVKMSIQAGIRHHIPLSMCGEMMGDKRWIELLLGLGLREFSVHPSSLLETKKIIMESHINRLTTSVRELLRTTSRASYDWY